VDLVVSGGGSNSGVEVVFDEEVVERVVGGEFEEVDVEVAVECDVCCWVRGVDLVYGQL
jgi:hypothetical protein